MKKENIIATCIALAIVVAAFVYFHRQDSSPTTPQENLSKTIATSTSPTSKQLTVKPKKTKKPSAKRFPNSDARKLFKNQIASLRKTYQQQRIKDSPNKGSDAHPPRSLSSEYLRGVVTEASPLLLECYQLALLENENLAGKVVVRFTIAGEPEVGGYVEKVSLSEDSEIQDEDFQECMRETIYSLQFDAPQNGGIINIKYPFKFSSK